MAAITLLGTATFNTTSGTHTVTATPAVGDLIVIVVANTGSTNSVAPTDNQSGTYTLINSAVKATSADTMRMYVRDSLVSSAVSTIYTQAPGTTSGGGLAVHKITGMPVAGIAAVRQSAIQSNAAAAATPTTTLSSAPLSANPLIGAVFNATSPATMTPRTSWTETVDVGYSTPTTGLEVMTRNSGETNATISWGGTSASAYCAITVELALHQPPSVVLSTADQSGFTTGTPTLAFIGTDLDASDIRYNIQIATDSGFSTGLIDKLSGTDSGFSNVTTPADTDPFNSANTINYTVQGANTLSNGAYYWRVRAIDPNDTNGYGDWSSTQSFGVLVATSLRTNLVPNPTFESTLSPWIGAEGTNGGTLTVSQSTTFSLTGTGSAKLINTTAGEDDYLFYQVTNLKPSTTYTMSAYAYLSAYTAGATSNQAMLAVARPSVASIGQALLTTTTTGVWVRYDCQVATNSTDTAVDLRLYSPQATIYWDAVMLEEGTTLGSYFDGSSSGAQWTGATGNSRSIISSVVTTVVSITKSLSYSIKKTPTAPTKSLKYTTKTTPSAKTKSLKYTVRKTASALTKALKYTVTKSATTITKPLKYTAVKTASPLTKTIVYRVRQTPTALTRSLKYTVKKSLSLTKSLKYTITASASAVTKSLKYATRTTPTSLTKNLKYTVRTTPAAFTKSLRYAIDRLTAPTKTLKYTVKSAPSAKTKSLHYIVATAVSLTKTLTYDVKAPKSVTKTLKYSVVKQASALTKSLRYATARQTPITKSLKYTVKAPVALTKSLRYAIKAPAAVTKQLKYTVKTTTTAITKSGKYTVKRSLSLTKGLIYDIKRPVSLTKTLKYTVKTSQSVSKALKYTTRITGAATTKSLRYAVQRPSAITKSLKYTTRSAHSITKGLIYDVRRTAAAVTKGLIYRLPALQYFRESKTTLPTTNAILATRYNSTDMTNAATADSVYVDLAAVSTYQIHEFASYNASQSTITLTWTGKSAVAGSVAAITLQIYNFNSAAWETLQSNTTVAANTNLTLTGNKITGLQNYYDANNYVWGRVYQ